MTYIEQVYKLQMYSRPTSTSSNFLCKCIRIKIAPGIVLFLIVDCTYHQKAAEELLHPDYLLKRNELGELY